MPKVKFIKEGKEIEVPEGANLRQEALKAGIPVYRRRHQMVNCRGKARCGTCRVLIRKGLQNASPMQAAEKRRLALSIAYTGMGDELRLACQTQVTGDMEVDTRPGWNLFGEAFWT